MTKNLVSLVFFVLAGLGCTKNTEKSTPNKPREVNLAIWGNYFTKAEQERFSNLTGIRLNITNYSSNEELLAKIQTGASGIDVAVPSDYMVSILIKMGALEPLNKELITNRDNLDPQFLDQNFDPGNKYSYPYAWSTAGIAIRKDLVKSAIQSWKDFLSDKEIIGKFSLLDDVRETLAVAAKINSASVNTTDPKDLEKIRATLNEIKKGVRMFRSEAVDPLVNKEVVAAHAYSLDALQAWRRTKGKVEYVLPEEGGTWAIDNLVILKGSKNMREAYELIDFFYRPESNVALVEHLLAGPVLKKTRERLPEDLKNLPALFPPKEKLAKLERIQDLGEKTREYDRIWTEMKSQ